MITRQDDAPAQTDLTANTLFKKLSPSSAQIAQEKNELSIAAEKCKTTEQQCKVKIHEINLFLINSGENNTQIAIKNTLKLMKILREHRTQIILTNLSPVLAQKNSIAVFDATYAKLCLLQENHIEKIAMHTKTKTLSSEYDSLLNTVRLQQAKKFNGTKFSANFYKSSLEEAIQHSSFLLDINSTIMQVFLTTLQNAPSMQPLTTNNIYLSTVNQLDFINRAFVTNSNALISAINGILKKEPKAGIVIATISALCQLSDSLQRKINTPILTTNTAICAPKPRRYGM
jgi:hypothetical protein